MSAYSVDLVSTSSAEQEGEEEAEATVQAIREERVVIDRATATQGRAEAIDRATVATVKVVRAESLTDERASLGETVAVDHDGTVVADHDETEVADLDELAAADLDGTEVADREEAEDGGRGASSFHVRANNGRDLRHLLSYRNV